MIALLCFVLAVLAAPFKSKSRLEAENAALRHQLIVLRRKVQGQVRFTNNDRWFFIQLYRHWSLDKDAPVPRPVQRIGSINSHAILGGLHHQYVRV
jgi:hypothetical protein